MTGTMIAAFILFLLDLLLFNYLIGSFAVFVLIIACIVTVIKYIWVLITKKGEVLIKKKLIIGGIYVLMIVMIFTANGLNNKVASSRANMLINKCEDYKREHGEYPSELSDLVPDYIEKIPSAKITGIQNEFHYYSRKGSHILYYISVPPFGHQVYRFETREWNFID